MELKEELKQAALDWLERNTQTLSCPQDTARHIRSGHPPIGYDTSGLVAAMLDVCEGYEELVGYGHRSGSLGYVAFAREAAMGYTVPCIVLQSKPAPEPEPVTVSRETLAVMRETIKDIPNVDQRVRDALTEANKVL